MSVERIKELVEGGAFRNLSAGGDRDRQEVMIHVYWSATNDERDLANGRKGHLLQRDRVVADLGLDGVPNPPFTEDEMQRIAFGAKIAALKVLHARAAQRETQLRDEVLAIIEHYKPQGAHRSFIVTQVHVDLTRGDDRLIGLALQWWRRRGRIKAKNGLWFPSSAKKT